MLFNKRKALHTAYVGNRVMELHDEIVELARQMADDRDIYFRNGGINELAPGMSFVWHRDSGEEYVEFMHYFSGSSPENGCLRVVPGSHVGPVDELMADVERRRQTERGSAADMLAAEAVRLLEEHRIGGGALMVVDDDNRPVGALNMQDLLRAGVI